MLPLRFPNSGIRAKLRLARRGGSRPRAWSLVARGPLERPARKGLPLVGAAASVAGAIAPCQRDCRQTRAAAA
ncbi:hypothetical protein B296_00038228 [Ensete ventricosum]|uniref:Uncharacterized protein n=1 Tax=Ensete ventricosum TaxID=4639 RepID=A0A426X579_ENSVE|nr:hypothetical protein B296_00038228 [Ensete ventricosum]